MKNLLYIGLLLLLAGCEVIDRNEQLIPVEEHDGNRRHVLFDFTGFRCVNCPTAAELAQELVTTHEGQLYVVSLHPASNPFTQGAYDYTCPAADSVYQWMGGTASTPFPAGNIDMHPFDEHWFSDMSAWATMVYEAMNDSVKPTVGMDVKIAYWLVEDSVPGVQAMPNGSVNTQYYHRHMLRATWPENPFGESTQYTGTETMHIPDVPEGCDRDKLSVLTLYFEPNTNHLLDAYETTLDFRTNH